MTTKAKRMPAQGQIDRPDCPTTTHLAVHALQMRLTSSLPTTSLRRHIRSTHIPGWHIASLVWLVMVLLTLAACTPLAQTQRPELVVFAAASLTDAFTELGDTFTEENGVSVTFNFAGSQTLAGQLTSGAPADVFASANDRQMQAAIDAARVDPAAVRYFAANSLVIVTPRDNPAAIEAPADLAAPGLKLVLADAAVPAGQYSLQFLDNTAGDPAFPSDYRDAVLANVASYEENVRAVLAKVTLGEADAGIVYSSDVTRGLREQVQLIAIPAEVNVVATYPIAPVADSAQPEMARAFADFVVSPAGQAILEKYGFDHVQP